MLKTTDFIRTFPVVDKTDRDCEVPVLTEFIQSIAPVDSLLDVGAYRSHTTYAKKIRPLIKTYYAIDILPDPETEKIVDKYMVGNANDDLWIKESFDVVVSVSVFEHAGVSTYKGDHRKEVADLFSLCLKLSKKYVWISFDCGQPYVYPNELSLITEDLLSEMEEVCKPYKLRERFFHSQGPQAGHPWYEHTKRDVAYKIPYIDYVGNCSITILEIEK